MDTPENKSASLKRSRSESAEDETFAKPLIKRIYSLADICADAPTSSAGSGTPAKAPSSSGEDDRISDDTANMSMEHQAPVFPRGFRAGRRVSVCAEPFVPGAAPERKKVVVEKSDKAYRRIRASTRNNLLFKNLYEEQQQDVYDAMFEKQCERGDVVIRQGDDGDNFYVVDKGRFDVFLARKNVDFPGEKVLSIREGGSFGELALMYNAPRAATVIAGTGDSVLWAVDRGSFQRIIMEKTARKRKLYEKFLAQVEVLRSLTDTERSRVADCLEPIEFEEGEAILEEGDDNAHRFYIIEEGSAAAFKGSKKRPVATYERGDYFGELALLNDAPRAATVRARGGVCKCVTLDRAAFNRLLGPCQELLKRDYESD